MERHKVDVTHTHPIRDLVFRALEGDLTLVEGEAVEARAMLGSEGLQLVERAFLLEHRSIAFERVGRVEDARATATGCFSRFTTGRQ